MEWDNFLKNVIEVRGRLVPGFLLLINLLLLFPRELSNNFLKAETPGLIFSAGLVIAIVLAYLIGAISLYWSFRALAKIWDKPHPKTFFEIEDKKICKKRDAQVKKAREKLAGKISNLEKGLEQIPNHQEFILDIKAATETETENEAPPSDKYISVVQFANDLSDRPENKLPESVIERVTESRDLFRTIIETHFAVRPRRRLLQARIGYYAGIFGGDYYGRWDQKVVFDTVKARLLGGSSDSVLASKLNMTEARVNWSAGMVVPFAITALSAAIFAYGSYFSAEQFNLGALIVFVLAFVGVGQSIWEFRRQVLYSEPLLVYEAYYQRFAGSTAVIKTELIPCRPGTTPEDEYKNQFRRASNALAEYPTDASYRQFKCNVVDLLESKLFPVWFVNAKRSKFVPYWHDQATPLTIMQLAGIESLAKEKLDEWDWLADMAWLKNAFREPVLIEICEGCGRRLVKDGCHRLLVLAAIARGKSYMEDYPTESVMVELEAGSKETRQEVETHKSARRLLGPFKIKVIEVASSNWGDHSVSDMQKVCICPSSSPQ